MPVVAESPPLVFGGTSTPVGTPISTVPVGTPKSTKTPKPSKTPKPVVTIAPSGDFVSRHLLYVQKVDSLGTCFSRTDFSEFNDTEFVDHTAIAIQDKYLTNNVNNTFCSVQAIDALSKTLKRLGEE